MVGRRREKLRRRLDDDKSIDGQCEVMSCSMYGIKLW